MQSTALVTFCFTVTCRVLDEFIDIKEDLYFFLSHFVASSLGWALSSGTGRLMLSEEKCSAVLIS